MKLQRLLLFIAIPVFALLIAGPLFAKADDATSTLNITAPEITASSTGATSTIADATSTIVSSTPSQPPVNINFEIEGPSSTLFSNSRLSVPPCITPNNSSSTVNGFCAFGAAGVTTQASWSSYGALINSINGISGDSNNFWLWFLNGDPAPVGIDSYILKPGDSLLWALGREPLKVNLSTTTPTVNTTTTVTVLGFDPVKFDFEPVAGASIIGASATTDTNGKADIVATSTNSFVISVTADGFLPSKQFTITPKPEQITLTIRDGTTTAFYGSLTLPDLSAADILVTPTNSTTSVAVSPRSALGILESVESPSSGFNITDLQYYPPSASFPNGSFLINCILVPQATSTPGCYNWHDTINGLYPNVGVDQQILQDGDNIFFFFSSNPTHQTVLSKNSVSAGESFTATAEQFDPQTNIYKPLTGVTLGMGTPNPDYTFTELATSTVNTNGQAIFTLNATGTFEVGIKEDYYFPSATIIISAATSTSDTSTDTTSAPQSGITGGGGINHSTLNISNALSFISGNQNPDGSFDSTYSTDWTAIAFSAAFSPGSSKTKLRDYLLNNLLNSPTLTDYERRAMALEALGIDPYLGTKINYISAITSTFDGAKINTHADNENIFALLPLEHAGFSPDDQLIQKIVPLVLSAQSPNGSWDGTPDMTAAALQALEPLSNISGVSSALDKAAGYLKSSQELAGGWGSIDSTSWVQTAINEMAENSTPGYSTENIWASSNGLLPTDILATAQKPDGGIDVPANRVWSTSYAVVAASGKSWVTILNSFPKPIPQKTEESGTIGKVLGITTSTKDTLINKDDATSTNISSILQPDETFIINKPSATTSVMPEPKIKIHLPRIKNEKYLKPTQKILSQEISSDTATAPQNQPTTKSTANKTNFLINIWQGIFSFFQHLF